MFLLVITQLVESCTQNSGCISFCCSFVPMSTLGYLGSSNIDLIVPEAFEVVSKGKGKVLNCELKSKTKDNIN